MHQQSTQHPLFISSLVFVVFGITLVGHDTEDTAAEIGCLSGIRMYLQVNGDLLNMSNELLANHLTDVGVFCTEGLV